MVFPFPTLKMTPNWFRTHFMQLFWNLENPTNMLYKAPYIYEHLGTWPVLHGPSFLLIGRNSFTDCVPKVNYFLLKLLTCVLAQFSARVRTRNGTKSPMRDLLPGPKGLPTLWGWSVVRWLASGPLSPSLALAPCNTPLAFARLALLWAGLLDSLQFPALHGSGDIFSSSDLSSIHQ